MTTKEYRAAVQRKVLAAGSESVEWSLSAAVNALDDGAIPFLVRLLRKRPQDRLSDTAGLPDHLAEILAQL